MPEEFFHRDMRVFMDQRFDWARYLRLRQGDGVNVADDVATFREVLRTTGDICESIAGESRGRWRDEVELVDGEVVKADAVVCNGDVAQAYRTIYGKEESDDEYYLMSHMTHSYLVFPEQGFQEFYRRDVTPEQMAESLACFVDAAS